VKPRPPLKEWVAIRKRSMNRSRAGVQKLQGRGGRKWSQSQYNLELNARGRSLRAVLQGTGRFACATKATGTNGGKCNDEVSNSRTSGSRVGVC